MGWLKEPKSDKFEFSAALAAILKRAAETHAIIFRDFVFWFLSLKFIPCFVKFWSAVFEIYEIQISGVKNEKVQSGGQFEKYGGNWNFLLGVLHHSKSSFISIWRATFEERSGHLQEFLWQEQHTVHWCAYYKSLHGKKIWISNLTEIEKQDS